jgi:diguanylate cyclase (GGDEF)-like protein
MKKSPQRMAQKGLHRATSVSVALVGTAALFAIVTTYLLANSGASVEFKTTGFSGIVAAFLFSCAFVYFRQVRTESDIAGFLPDDRHLAKERTLDALDEMTEFLGGTIGRTDVLRLICGHIRNVVPIKTGELLLLNESRTRLVVANVEGPGGEGAGRIVEIGEGAAGVCYLSGEVRIEDRVLEGVRQHAVAIPLRHRSEVFGVLQLSFEAEYSPNEDVSLHEAVGNRVSPLILSAIAFERSTSNALTDATTDLPNERAFHLILENQVAESQRKGDERPLTILAIDIKNFDEINKRFGHLAGDRTLNFAANLIKDSLRQMDFFARSRDDEFLVVLPTATKKMSSDIITRIQTSFFGRKVRLTDSDAVEVGLNFGWAAFGADGETPEQLLKTARLRKSEAKSSTSSKVLWFPHEFVH